MSLLRASMPYVNQYHSEVIDWLVAEQNITVDVESIDAGWYKFGPALIINTIDVKFSDEQPYDFDVRNIKIKVDFWNSILERKLLIDNLILDGVDVKIPLTPFFDNNPSNQQRSLSETSPNQLFDVFLRQLNDFELTNSQVRILNPAGDEKIIHLQTFRWQNQGRRHRGEGLASISNGNADNYAKIIVDLENSQSSLIDMTGQIYLQAENLNLSSWFDKVLFKRQGIKQGIVSFETWIELQNNAVQNALVQLNPSSFSWQSEQRQQSFKINAGQLQLHTTDLGWQLDSYGLALNTNGKPWPELSLQLRNENNTLFFAANQVELAALTPIVALSRHVDDATFNDIAELQPRGLVNKIKLKLPLDNWQSLQYQLQVDSLAVNAWQGVPAVSNLDFTVTGLLDQGVGQLSLENAELDVRQYFPHQLQVDQLSSDFSWSIYDQTHGEENSHGIEIIVDNLVLDTPEVSINSQLLLDIPTQGNSFLSLSGKAQLRDASKAYYYYPTEYMGEELIAYLQAGLQAGQTQNAQLLWFGEFAQYPYSQGEGIFQAKLKMHEGQFSFDPEWPALTDLELNVLFENDDLWLGPGKAKLGKVIVQRVSGNLLNLGDAESVVIDAQFASDGESAIELINQSPLDPLKDTFVDTQIRDALTGSLHLNIPLSDEEVSLSGAIELRDNTVYLQPLDLTLKHVKSTVEFTESIVRAPVLQAQLWQQPVTAKLDISEKGSNFNIDIGLQGRWNSADVVPIFAPILTEQVTGEFDWQGNVNVVVDSNNELKYSAEIITELDGVSTALPLPLSKSKHDIWPTRVELSGSKLQSSLWVNIRDDMQLQTTFAHDENTVAIISSQVNIGDVKPTAAQLGENGINIALDTLDIVSWSDWYNRLDRGQLNKLQSQEVEVLPTQIQVMIEQLEFQQQKISDLSISGAGDANGLDLIVQANEFYSTVKLAPSKPANVRFEYLYFPDLKLPEKTATVNSNKEVIQPDWLQLPSFNVSCGVCIVNTFDLGSIDVAVTNNGKALTLDKLQIDMLHTQLNATGQWQLDGQGKPETKFKGALKTESAEQLAVNLGQESPLVKTPMDVLFDFVWDADMSELSPANMSGYIKLEGKQGRVSSVSDKGTRFLSILSLQSLVKKLSLDFSDVFNNELAYDSLSGSAYIINGVATNDDLVINSSSGRITGSGSLYWVTEEIDYTFNFYPDITSSLPVLTAFAVTPITAIAVFALSKILEPVVDVITELRFKVSGNLNDLQFTEVKRSESEVKVPTKLFESRK